MRRLTILTRLLIILVCLLLAGCEEGSGSEASSSESGRVSYAERGLADPYPGESFLPEPGSEFDFGDWQSEPTYPAGTAAPIPEPSTVVLLASGAAALVVYKRRPR
ncbi:MAG: PEP-CTERM sorting domain-containing protein [Candidatus Brocadiia bacterium]